MPTLRNAVRAAPGVLPRVRPPAPRPARGHPGARDRVAPPVLALSGRLDLARPRAPDHRRARGAVGSSPPRATARRRRRAQRPRPPSRSSTGTDRPRLTPTETSTLPTVPTDDGSEQPPPPPPSNTLIQWPAGQNGWTIVLSSIPQSAGRGRRPARAKGAERRADGRRNPRLVPVLEPAHRLLRGLHGVYDSENEARAALDTAQGSYPQSYVRQITQ